MKKYFVLDYYKNGCGDSFGGDKPFDTFTEAETEAFYQWNHLTTAEKKKRIIEVAYGEVDEDGYLADEYDGTKCYLS